VAVAEANETDGYRMVCALETRKLGRAVNRKRVLCVMRERRLIQRRRRLDRRRRPGFVRVTRPDELWPLDMTSVWIAEHGWCSCSPGEGSRIAAAALHLDLIEAVEDPGAEWWWSLRAIDDRVREIVENRRAGSRMRPGISTGNGRGATRGSAPRLSGVA
jgi:hypothetical protein